MTKISNLDKESELSKVNSENNNCLSEEEIRRYLFDTLTEQERFRLEYHITACNLCYDAITGARQYSSDQELLKQTTSIRETIQKRTYQREKNIQYHKFSYYTAAAVILISMSGIGYWLTLKPSDQITDEFLKPYSNRIPLTRSSNPQNLLEEAMMEYENEHYDAAIDKLRMFLITNPNHDDANLYIGISLLLTGNTTESEAYLQNSERSANRQTSETSKWYLALAYLKMNENEKGLLLIKKIIQDGGFYASSASSLLERL